MTWPYPCPCPARRATPRRPPARPRARAVCRAGSILAVASDDGTVKVFNVDLAACATDDGKASAHLNDLRGHDQAVQCVVFEPNSNKYLVTSSSDASYRIWS